MTTDKLKTLEALLREFRDESVDQSEFAKRESVRFDVMFEIEAREEP